MRSGRRKKYAIGMAALTAVIVGGVIFCSCGCGSDSMDNTGSSSSGSGGAYSQSGGSADKEGVSYSTSDADISAVYVDNTGTLTLTGATVTKSGDSSNPDNSSFQGLNAAVLARSGANVTMSGCDIVATGIGANGAFANGTGSTVNCTDVDMNTTGPNSGAIATDRGSGTIDVTGGTVTTSGADAPGIYSTGKITVTGADISATGSESAVIEGGNSITLTDTSLKSSLGGKWGVLIFQSMSGDATGTRGTFTMTGGDLALTATSGPLFYVTNSTGVITLKGVNVTSGSGVLLKAAADRWGNSGSNGGNAQLTADGQTLTGDIQADASSTITLTLRNGSSLTGAINSANTAKSAVLTLDASSTWNVTADSYLTGLDDIAGISGTTVTNITGNGHTVCYDSASCPALGGLTYTLAGGGTLTPM